MLAVIGTDVVVILISVLMINLSEKGQYPLWWMGFGWENPGVAVRAIDLTSVTEKTRSTLKRSTGLVLSNKRSKGNENIDNQESIQESV